MGTSDGTVGAKTKLVDHGSDAERWTLVILSEGFQASEIDSFHTAAESFCTKLFNTPPFRQMWCAINVYRVDVTSTDSGADEPATCADGENGTGATARTYFDASFCQNNTGRLLFGNQARALTTAQTAVPEADATIVIVNSTRYGGAGSMANPIAWFSLAPSADDIGIHELGHSAFKLQDEYGDGTIATHTAGEPPEANVTTITDRATTKWANRIAASTPLPTQENPGCGAMNPAPSPVPAATVGLFAGGVRAFCGIYHPEHSCMMQKLGDPFCAVCSGAIIAVLKVHLPKFSGPTVGRQFSGSLQPHQSRRWFTYNWPACWHVLWTAVPTAPDLPDPGLRIRTRVERSSRERITYWLEVTNDSDKVVEFDGRYEILAR